MNFIKSLGRIIVTALLTAAIIVATRTGVLLPKGDTKVLHLEPGTT